MEKAERKIILQKESDNTLTTGYPDHAVVCTVISRFCTGFHLILAFASLSIKPPIKIKAYSVVSAVHACVCVLA